ncbi:MAG: Calx-beta domain-containing protein [Pyrinomonadaceae bacterium]
MPRSVRNVLIIIFTASLGLLLPAPGRTGTFQPAARAAAAFNVNSLSDGADSDLNDGVCNDGTDQCTLRAAVQQANQLAGADTVNITATGTISLTSELPRLSSMTLAGPGSAQLTVRRDPDAAAGFRIFTTELFSTVSISGLTVSGGRMPDDHGGGIYNSQSASLSLSDVVVTGNATVGGFVVNAGRGGGIYHNGASLTLTNCTVSNNSAASGVFGGPPSGRDGGGLYLDNGTVTITNSTVSGNRSGNSVINGSPGAGGGIYVDLFVTATLTNSTVSGNSVGSGFGGIPQGGGIFSASPNLALNSCTVVNNSSGVSGLSHGGGIAVNSSGPNANALRNTIVANNTAATGSDLFGTFTSQDFNLIRTAAGATINGTTTHNVTGVDPLLSPLQNNEGPTRAHVLLPGSPAIDAGDSGGLNNDQRGLARPVDNPSAANASDGADIGAFEVQPPTAAGQLQFSSASYSTVEGAGTAAVTVTRTGGSTGAVSATFNTSDGTAKAGEDYTTTSGLVVTFADGDAAPKTVQVPVTDDALNEPDESLELFLSNPSGGATFGSPAVATLTISDNNDPLPGLSIDDLTVPEGDAGFPTAFATVRLSAPSGYTVTVNCGTSDGTATAGNDYSPFVAGTVTFAPGQTSQRLFLDIRTDRVVEPAETFFVNLSNPTRAVISDAQGAVNIEDDDGDPPGVKFVETTYAFGEGSGVLFVTVTRTGLISGPASVEYATSDVTASERSDYTTALGRVQFAAGEHTKLVTVLLGEDNLGEGTETFQLTLSNPTGATIGPNSTVTVTIFDNDFADGPSPVASGPNFSSSFFVRQHYFDFLNRQPDTSGFDFWVNEIEKCGADDGCREVRRVNVSAAFFLSIEFQQTGYLAYRAHKAAFGNLAGKPVPVTRLGLLRDMQVLGSDLVVGADGWEMKLEQNKQTYFAQLASSERFTTLYPQTLTPGQYVDALNANAGGALSTAERDALVSDLTGGTKTRAQVLRAVAEDADLSSAEFNKAFVLMQYFGYLRRDPDAAPDSDFAGFNFWLGKLNEFNGDYIRAEMVKAFIDSIEYRNRFGL